MTTTVSDVTHGLSKNLPTLDSSLRKLWDKIKATSEVIQHLRQENQSLFHQLESLTSEIGSLRTEANEKELEIKRLRAERTQLIQAGSNNGFTDEEKEVLKGKIKDLIAKINSHF